MTDLTKQLGAILRDAAQDPSLDPWERLAAGELDDAGRAELERLAATDPEAKQKWDLFRPLDGAEQARIVAAVSRGASASSRAPGDVVLGPWLRRITFAALPIAAAAGVAFWLMQSSVAPLAAYNMVASGGVATQRGEAREPSALRVQEGARIELILRPAVSVGRDVVAYAFHASPALRHWPAETEISDDGAVRLVGSATPLVGSNELVVVIGRSTVLSSVAEAESRAQRGESGRGWQVLRQPLTTIAP